MSKCKHCGGDVFVKLYSVDQKLCADCKQYDHWPLKAGQESILVRGKQGERLLQEESRRDES